MTNKQIKLQMKEIKGKYDNHAKVEDGESDPRLQQKRWGIYDEN
jgi:hypothetical protein